MLKGRCHCGAVQYEMPEDVVHHSLCHCGDCRRHSGAPLVAWAMVPAERLRITGAPRVYQSSQHGRRHFCGACGTSLFYVNEAMLPGMIDVQTGTLDSPEKLPPSCHIQTAEKLPWLDGIRELPAFERYPG